MQTRKDKRQFQRQEETIGCSNDEQKTKRMSLEKNF